MRGGAALVVCEQQACGRRVSECKEASVRVHTGECEQARRSVCVLSVFQEIRR